MAVKPPETAGAGSRGELTRIPGSWYRRVINEYTMNAPPIRNMNSDRN